MTKNFLIIFLGILLVLTGIPQFALAKTPAKDQQNVEINLGWWNKFNDPILIDYINRAIDNNHELKSIFLKVSRSREVVRESLGAELPQVALLANYVRFRSFSFSTPQNIQKSYRDSFILPLFANYEVDLWQKNRKKTLAKGEKLEAARQDARAAYISLISEVASAYFNILKLDKFIELQTGISMLNKENLEIIRANYNAGLSSYNEVLNAQKPLTESQKKLTELDKQRNVFINQLLVLTGTSSENKDKIAISRNSIDNILLPADIPLEIPSKNIMQRPDILKAEAELKYAKLNVDIARRDFVPSLIVYGLLGFDSNTLKTLFNWKNYIAAFGSSFIGKIFSGGQLTARLKQRKFEYEQLLQDYQNTILTSLQEVNNSLYNFKSDLKINENNISRLQLESGNLSLVNAKYRNGLSSKLDTIQPGINVLVLQLDQTQGKTDYLIDSINLYKSLGGQI